MNGLSNFGWGSNSSSLLSNHTTSEAQANLAAAKAELDAASREFDQIPIGGRGFNDAYKKWQQAQAAYDRAMADLDKAKDNANLSKLLERSAQMGFGVEVISDAVDRAFGGPSFAQSLITAQSAMRATEAALLGDRAIDELVEGIDSSFNDSSSNYNSNLPSSYGGNSSGQSGGSFVTDDYDEVQNIDSPFFQAEQPDCPSKTSYYSDTGSYFPNSSNSNQDSTDWAGTNTESSTYPNSSYSQNLKDDGWGVPSEYFGGTRAGIASSSLRDERDSGNNDSSSLNTFPGSNYNTQIDLAPNYNSAYLNDNTTSSKPQGWDSPYLNSSYSSSQVNLSSHKKGKEVERLTPNTASVGQRVCYYSSALSKIFYVDDIKDNDKGTISKIRPSRSAINPNKINTVATVNWDDGTEHDYCVEDLGLL